MLRRPPYTVDHSTAPVKDRPSVKRQHGSVSAKRLEGDGREIAGTLFRRTALLQAVSFRLNSGTPRHLSQSPGTTAKIV